MNVDISFSKTPTGILGLDEITYGGFPTGRPTLICGNAGCGKTLFGIQFLVKGITEYNEPGVFMSFEETSLDLSKNVLSLGFDLEKLKSENLLKVDYVRVERSEIEETGEYDLEALFIRLNYAIDSIGAKRVVLDTIETLFGGMNNNAILRSEIRRLFMWLKDKGVTAIITGEKGDWSLTRTGLEEYVSDCVILLDFRVQNQLATRRLRVIKYRGSMHGTYEYPFIIDQDGIAVLPITSLKLDYSSPQEIISLGLPDLDKLFSLKGVYKASCILVTGSAGTAKTIMAYYFALSSCLRNERVLYFSLEESEEQMLRNIQTIGMDLRNYTDTGLLTIKASRPSLHGLEIHLHEINHYMRKYKPQTIIIDSISSLISIGNISEVSGMLVRLMDTLKVNKINALFTSLSHKNIGKEHEMLEAVSSLADTWIELTYEIVGGERKRNLLIVKSRGMGHIDNPQEFKITEKGVQLL